MMPTLSRSKASRFMNHSSRRHGLPMVLFLGLLSLLPAVAAAQPSPVVIAVDTSRSLNASAPG